MLSHWLWNTVLGCLFEQEDVGMQLYMWRIFYTCLSVHVVVLCYHRYVCIM